MRPGRREAAAVPGVSVRGHRRRPYLDVLARRLAGSADRPPRRETAWRFRLKGAEGPATVPPTCGVLHRLALADATV